MNLKTDEENEHKTITPPYISYLTFNTFLEWLKEMPVVPTQIDRSLWKYKFAGSTGIQLMTGLKFLKLLDGQKTEPMLAELVKVDKDKRKVLIKEVLRKAYGADIVDELPAMTPKVLDDKLHALGTTDSTHRKALSFFVNAAKYNGVTVPPSISKKARIRRSGTRQRPQKSGIQSSSQIDTSTKSQAANQVVLHSALTALLKDLEKTGSKWTKTERNIWLKTFETNLDYAYPVHDGENTKIFANEETKDKN
jgi:hypothetical protein